jgi:predicted nuclease with RNAse H fold
VTGADPESASLNLVGIDLAATTLNPTGWAALKGKVITVCQLFSDEEIVNKTLECTPSLIAIDAPLSFPINKGLTRKTDREMQKRGYRVLPPRFRTMEKLTMRATKLAQKIRLKGRSIIEVHPTSTRKALKMPTKEWPVIQEIFVSMGFGGDVKTRALTPHEIDAVTAAFTGYMHLRQKTELLGDRREGYIVVPIQIDWRLLKP